MNSLLEKYDAVYSPLWNTFIESISGVEVSKCPAPHLPLFGDLYENSPNRIAFIGIETAGWENLEKYKNSSLIEYFEDCQGYMEDQSFREWGKPQGMDFWGFAFKFLAKYYGVSDWKELKYAQDDKIDEILRSIVWAETNSVERYHVSAQKENVPFDAWQKIKYHSKIFDRFQHIHSALNPKLVLIQNWMPDDDSWVRDGFEDRIILEDWVDKDWFEHLYYYQIKSDKEYSHIYLTAHATSLKFDVGFDELINKILEHYKSVKTVSPN